MDIDQNCLIEILDNANSVISTWRVLWAEKDDIVVIQLYNLKALPIWRKRKELELELVQNTARFTDNDSFSALYRSEEYIPASHRTCRDHRYKIIAPIIESGEKVFDPHERGSLIRIVSDQTGVTKKTIYSYLRSWWWGGQKSNALLPGWERCGGKGKERIGRTSVDIEGSNKGFQPQPGRPSQLTKLRGKPSRIRIDKRIQKLILRAAKLYHERKGMTLKDARQKMLERFFSVKVKDVDGNEIPILVPEEQRPSLRQFVYWYYQDREARFREALINREGERRYNTLHRELLSNSMRLAPYPGALWQIDSTVLDIYAVSNLDRSRLIGRPILYLVVDVFSRMIVGFSLTLEGPSWFGAALALENATTDKVQFCKEFGITISLEEWLCQHICKFLLTDRGSEYLSDHTTHLKNALGVTLMYTPAYRPDWKAVVERRFRIINDLVIHWQPGAVDKEHGRGDPDYRLNAIYTLHELRQILIHLILFYNNYHLLEEYPISKAMIEDRISPVSSELWEWGVQECGRPRKESPDIIRLNLLPTAEATVTRHGISLLSNCRDVSFRERMLYNCDLANREQWFVKAERNGSWRIPVAYNPRNMDQIYLRLDNGRQIEVCNLLDTSEAYRSTDWYEIADHFANTSMDREQARPNEEQGKAILNAHVERITTQAQKQTKTDVQGKSNRSRLSGVNEQRRDERDREGKENAWKLGSKETALQADQTVPNNVMPNAVSFDANYVPPPQDTDLVNELLDESWSGS